MRYSTGDVCRFRWPELSQYLPTYTSSARFSEDSAREVRASRLKTRDVLPSTRPSASIPPQGARAPPGKGYVSRGGDWDKCRKF